MKTFLTSIAAGSLLAMLAAAQPASPKADPTAAAALNGRRGLPNRANHPGGGIPGSASHGLLVYVITGGLQFGAVDLRSGTFLPIGPGLPPDVGGGLVPGPRKSLLTLSFSGNLDAIDPATGVTSVVGATGLGDCSTSASPCGPNSANGMGRLDGRYYATDFANNLYSVDPVTGAAKLLGPTGIPGLPFIPLSVNPDGSLNVFDESLFSFRGKLYANFAAAVLNPDGPPTVVIPPAIYEIDRKTGHAMWITSTDLGLTSIVNMSDTIYAFNAATGQIVTLDLTNGQTSPVSELDPAAGLIGGATPARPAPKADH